MNKLEYIQSAIESLQNVERHMQDDNISLENYMRMVESFKIANMELAIIRESLYRDWKKLGDELVK